MAKVQAPEKVPAGQIHCGDDVVIRHGREMIACRITIATHGNTGPGGRNIVVLHCSADDGSDFPEVIFADEVVTRTHAALVAA